MNVYKARIDNFVSYIDLKVTADTIERARQLVFSHLEISDKLRAAEQEQHKMARAFFASDEDYDDTLSDYAYSFDPDHIELMEKDIEGSEEVKFADAT